MNPLSSQTTSWQMDEQAALAGLGGNRDLLNDLAGMFCEDAPDMLRQLRCAAEAQDAKAARRAAHSLKGAAAMFYARPTIQQAEQLEVEAARGNLADMLNGGLVELEQQVLSLMTELRQRFD